MWGAEMTIPLPPTGAWRLEGGGFARLREGEWMDQISSPAYLLEMMWKSVTSSSFRNFMPEGAM